MSCCRVSLSDPCPTHGLHHSWSLTEMCNSYIFFHSAYQHFPPSSQHESTQSTERKAALFLPCSAAQNPLIALLAMEPKEVHAHRAPSSLNTREMFPKQVAFSTWELLWEVAVTEECFSEFSVIGMGDCAWGKGGSSWFRHGRAGVAF